MAITMRFVLDMCYWCRTRLGESETLEGGKELKLEKRVWSDIKYKSNRREQTEMMEI